MANSVDLKETWENLLGCAEDVNRANALIKELQYELREKDKCIEEALKEIEELENNLLCLNSLKMKQQL